MSDKFNIDKISVDVLITSSSRNLCMYKFEQQQKYDHSGLSGMTIREGSRMQRSTPTTLLHYTFPILLFIFHQVKLIRALQQNLTLKFSFEDFLPVLCEHWYLCVKSPEVECSIGVNEERAPVWTTVTLVLSSLGGLLWLLFHEFFFSS
jgi:hypothetical protein